MTRRLFALERPTFLLGVVASLGLALGACGGSSPATGTGGHVGTADASVGGHVGTDAGLGGHTGVGGNTGVGGSGGSPACLSAPYTHVWPFGGILDNWVVATNSNPSSLAPAPGVDGGPPTGTDVTIDSSDSSDGSPMNGSVRLSIPFNAPGQEMLFAQNFSALNMAGTTITAQIKLVSGLNTDITNVGRAFLIVKSTASYIYAAGTPVSLDPSAGWTKLSINVDAPPQPIFSGYDPCDIREIDVSVQTGTQGTFTTAVVRIDTIAVTGPGSDAGTGDAGSDALDAAPATDAADAPDAGDTTDAPAPQDAAIDAVSPG